MLLKIQKDSCKYQIKLYGFMTVVNVNILSNSFLAVHFNKIKLHELGIINNRFKSRQTNNIWVTILAEVAKLFPAVYFL